MQPFRYGMGWGLYYRMFYQVALNNQYHLHQRQFLNLKKEGLVFSPKIQSLCLW